jgi:hypothetical protein
LNRGWRFCRQGPSCLCCCLALLSGRPCSVVLPGVWAILFPSCSQFVEVFRMVLPDLWHTSTDGGLSTPSADRSVRRAGNRAPEPNGNKRIVPISDSIEALCCRQRIAEMPPVKRVRLTVIQAKQSETPTATATPVAVASIPRGWRCGTRCLGGAPADTPEIHPLSE